jgi:RNA polymerase sigma-70 factor (ECF subfamily)
MLKVWLLQYAYHRALNRRRHLEANLFYKWVDLNLAGQEPSLSRDPHAVIEAAQLMERLLGSLSSRRRSIIELTYFEGLTAEEIAVKLGESVSAVRHELYRGLARLRERMAKQTKQAAGNTAEAKEALRPNAQAI